MFVSILLSLRSLADLVFPLNFSSRITVIAFSRDLNLPAVVTMVIQVDDSMPLRKTEPNT